MHLNNLSQIINRQRDISLQINDKIDVHTGLLQGLDEELDYTGSHMSQAQQKLDRVAKGARENSMFFALNFALHVLTLSNVASTVLIAIIILILLILIIIFNGT